MILLLLILLASSIFLATVCGVRFERSIPLTCIAIIFILFLSGLTGHLTLGLYAIYGITGLLYFVSVGVLVKRQCFIQFRDAFFATPFVVFVFLFVCLIFANTGTYSHEEDEFLHWMLAVKSLIRNDMLATGSHDLRISNGYPPGVTLFQYFLTRVLTRSGGDTFIEWPSYMAIQLLALVTVFPLFRRKYFKSVVTTIMILLAAFVFPLFFYYNFYSSCYVDGFLGVISGTSMATVLLTPREDKDRFYHLLIYAECMLLVFSKRTGFIMAGFLMVAYLLDLLSSEQNCVMARKRVLKYAVGVLVAIGLPLAIWKATIRTDNEARTELIKAIQPIVAGATEDVVSESTLGTMIRVISTGDLGYRKDVIKGFVESFFDYSLSLGSTGIILNYVVVLVTAVVGFYLLYLFYGRYRAPEQKMVSVMSTYFLLQLLGWFVFFLVCYMFVFSESEGVRLMSFGRYLRTGFMSVYIPLLFAWCDLICDFPERRKKAAAAMMSVFLITISPIKEIVVFLGHQYPAQADTAHEPVAELYEASKNLPHNGAKVYYIECDKDADPKYSAQMSYLIYPDYISLSMESASEEESWIERLINNRYDYVMIRTIDKDFIRAYGKFFVDGTPEASTIYRVDAEKSVLQSVE